MRVIRPTQGAGLTIAGFDDWYVPALYELRILYRLSSRPVMRQQCIRKTSHQCYAVTANDELHISSLAAQLSCLSS